MEPYEPTYWWTDMLLKYAGYVRRLTITFAVAVLSAFVALEVNDHLQAQTPTGNFLVTDFAVFIGTMVAFLFLWFCMHVGFKCWRLSRVYPGLFKKRHSLGDFLVAGFTIGTLVPLLVLGMAFGPR